MNAPAASILVVDDEPDLRTLYELTLLREGYRVETASNVQEAREQLKAQREALQAARLSGVFQIKAGDKWITYRSDKEIQAALADVDREIAQMEGRPRPRRIRAYCSKGL